MNAIICREGSTMACIAVPGFRGPKEPSQGFYAYENVDMKNTSDLG